MPAVSQCAELSVAWALVCILHILATDSLQTLDDKHDSVIVLPPPGLDPPGCPVVKCKGTAGSLDPEMQVSLLWL